MVAAGFEYRPIRTPADMPECFSRPICALAMRLNDQATEAERQRLMPFVTRLACADSPEIEDEREDYIRSRTYSYIPFGKGLRILEEALAIGRQADVVAPEDVSGRLGAVRSAARTPSSIPDNSGFAKIKTWFGLSHATEHSTS